MTALSKYVQILLLLNIATIIICSVLIIYTNFFGTTVNTTEKTETKHKATSLSLHSKSFLHDWRNITDDQASSMSPLGRWLLSPEGSLLPAIKNTNKTSHLILIWKHGPFLERRHIKRFTNSRFSPWEGCSVKNCLLSYDPKDLEKADAVLFHLHQTEGKKELPQRTQLTQRWIFLTDESPLHTFRNGKQCLSDYNGLFNWSMTYRMDSDIPVPYGRTILASKTRTESWLELPMVKNKLVAIMGSNCGGANGRWNYVRALKASLGNDLDIYGYCLGGNTTACPGHFTKDCAVLDTYKFYLAFENSNCKEYLTEKVFWHGYQKWSVPVIMGAPRSDCKWLLPPFSFIHVQDFATPDTLAQYLMYLHRHYDEYLKYHEWRKHYKVINEHGYFGSTSRHYCRLCEALRYNSPDVKTYHDLETFWNKERDCSL